MLRRHDDLDEDRLLSVERDALGARAPTIPPVSGAIRLRRRRFAIWSLIAAFLLFLGLVVWLATVAPPSQTGRPIVSPSTTFLASDGSLISRRGAITDRAVDIRALPAHIGNAFVAIEDRRFYGHYGVDPRGLTRAAWHDLRSRSMREGGSTITQQLAKLVYLNSDRSAGRKIREALIALWLERWLSKDQILSRYLSDAYFGDNVYGLRAAARHYFSKPPERLTIGEAALLAGLMKAPSRLSPSENLAGARARAALVAKAMADGNFITPQQATDATATLRLKPAPEPKQATYFSDWVAPAAPPSADAYSGQIVRTTLDAHLQRLAEAAVGQVHLPGAQVALVAMREDGKVVAMVGGRNYAASSFNRATQARRQPGSTFKLFVYLAAIRAGMTPNDLVEDRPIAIGNWSPRNADGQYLGPITLRQAFARSSNVAAVRLAQKVGPGAVVRAANDLGIESPLNADPGIALGTSGVTLLELAGSYAAVARGAYPVRPYGIAEPSRDRRARSDVTPFSDGDRAMLLDLLSTTVNSGTARGAALTTQVYGKTGTSQDNRDALFVGFAGRLVTAVWIGRDDNRPMPGIAGGGLPAHTWQTFMAGAIGARPARATVSRSVDPDAGIDGLIHSVVGRLKTIFHF